MDASEFRLPHAGLPQSLLAFRVGTWRAETSEVKSIGFQGLDDRGVIQLRIMREGGDGDPSIKTKVPKRLVRPIVHKLHSRKPLRARERFPWINDGYLIASEKRHAGQRLGDVRTADNRKTKRRVVHRKKPPSALSLDSPGPVRTKRAVDRRTEFASLTRNQQSMLTTAFRHCDRHGSPLGPEPNQILENFGGQSLPESDWFHQDPDVAAASQPDRKGFFRRYAKPQRARRSILDRFQGRLGHGPFDTSSRNRAGDLQTAGHGEHGPHRTGGGTPRLDHRRKSSPAPLPMPGKRGFRDLIVTLYPGSHGLLPALPEDQTRSATPSGGSGQIPVPETATTAGLRPGMMQAGNFPTGLDPEDGATRTGVIMELVSDLFLDTVNINILLLVVVAVVTVWYGVKVVPQSQVYIVERFGRYTRTLNAGLSLIVPFLDRVAHRISILERQLPAFRISVITRDNVEVELETTVFFRIREADKSVYRIRDVELAIHTAATSIVRSAAGKQELDELQSARQQMNEEIQNNLRDAAEVWGVEVTRTEIVDVVVDEETRKAQRKQLAAEREKRAIIAQADGERQAVQLRADAKLYEAEREAEAIRVTAEADAYAVQKKAEADARQTELLAAAIANRGQPAVDFEIQKRQVEAVRQLGSSESAKVVVVPSDVVGALGALETLSQFVRGGPRAASREDRSNPKPPGPPTPWSSQPPE